MNVVLFLSRVQPVEVEDIMSAKTGDKGKHSPPGAETSTPRPTKSS
jgi:hypothetical protein